MRSRILRVAAVLLLGAGLARAEESAWTLLEKGIQAYRNGKAKRAEGLFKAALRHNGRCHDAYFYLGLLAERRGEPERALALYRRIDQEFPTYSLAAERRGHIALARGNREEAVREFELLAEKRPSAAAFLQLAAVEIDLKRYDDATETLDEAGKWTKNNVELLELRARLLMETGRFAEALDRYTRILEILPVDTSARYLRGTCLERLGRTAEALREYETVLERDPFHKLCLLRTIRLLEKEPDRAEQVARYKRRLEALAKGAPRVREVSGKKDEQ